MRPLPSMSELFFGLRATPRVHPNGFIQLDLDETRRLHVWHPLLPYHQRTYHPIHDHVFDLESTVYSGRLINACYDAHPCDRGSHVVWEAGVISGCDTELKATGERVGLSLRYATAVSAGMSYSFRKSWYHESLSNVPTMTVMTKSNARLTTGANCRGARVLVPVGVTPDNDFRREGHDEELLWDLIREAHPQP